MATNVKEATLEFIQDAKKYFLADMDTLSDDVFFKSPGGQARTPADIVFECNLIHRFIEKRLNSEDPYTVFQGVEQDANKFVLAPKGISRAELRAEFVASIDVIANKVIEADAEKLLSLVKTSSGEEPFYSLAMFAAQHSNYHNAQLALIAAINGDGKNYWF